MPPAATQDNKSSCLLSFEENQQISRLLGIRCQVCIVVSHFESVFVLFFGSQTLSTSVVQLYVTQHPHHSQWMKKCTGVLCFVKDNIRKNYFFRIFCLKKNNMLWEHEMYNNMEYLVLCPYLHSFEGEVSYLLIQP